IGTTGPALARAPSGGFLPAGFGIGPPPRPDPGFGLAEQLGHPQRVVLVEGVGILPLIDGLVLLAPAGGDRIPRAFFAVVLPVSDLDRAVEDLVDGPVALGLLRCH